MVSLKSAELLISVITFFIAYLGAVTIAGFFRAWTSKKMGDDTAEMMGLMTLNPIDHIDFIGLVFLLFFYFGWGKYVPINPFNIQEPHRRIKLILAYLSDAIAHLTCALIGVIVLIAVFGVHMLFVANTMLVCIQNMTHLYLVQACPAFSSFSITISFIIIAFVYLNVILGVLNLILNSFSLLMYFVMERSTNYKTYNYYLIILVPIILIVLFSEPLRILAIKLISVTGYGIAHLLHMV
jgi:hypothetical protein